jgi:hypothetical protein
MSVWPCLGAFLLLLAACTDRRERADPEVFRTPAPTFGDVIPSPPAPTTTPNGPTISVPIRGVLPDGTRFDLRLGPYPPEEVTAISARIGVALEDGSYAGSSIANFLPADDAGKTTAWEEANVYLSPAGPWVLRLVLDDGLMSRLGPDYQQAVEVGVRTSNISGFPVLELSPPFHFATDEEFSLHMQVMYDTFVVRPGCGELAVSCSSTEAVQFIPLPTTSRPRLPWDEDRKSIDVPRISVLLVSDSSPLDQGATPR